ncbi:type I glyceraldehyde-3-phosphate dehydrogenase [Streptomyces sp. NPDC054796]
MTTTVAINGFGRIGRGFLRAMLERDSALEIVAVNDVGDPELMAHLLRYDSCFGRLDWDVRCDRDTLRVDGRDFRFLNERDVRDLPWKELGVDIVVEATGLLTDADVARGHLEAGARKVLIAAPAEGEDLTVAYGVNHDRYDDLCHNVVSLGSCVTNALAPLAHVLDELFGIEHGLMTTVQACADERLSDGLRHDVRRGGGGGEGITPSTTGAARDIGRVLPRLDGRLDGYALCVPVQTGALLDLNVTPRRPTTASEVEAALRDAAQGHLLNVLACTEEPVVSSDIIANPSSCVVDLALTHVTPTQVRTVAWFDDECGLTNRLLDTAELIGRAWAVGHGKPMARAR